MDLKRVSRGERIAAVSALLLFVFMFFDWFTPRVAEVADFSGEVPGGGSAWDTLSVIPLFLMLAIVVALVVGLARLIDADLEPRISMNAIVAGLGALAALLILFRILDPPDISAFGGVGVETTRQLGVFLGLAAAIGIAAGGYSAMREEGLTFNDVADQVGSGASDEG